MIPRWRMVKAAIGHWTARTWTSCFLNLVVMTLQMWRSVQFSDFIGIVLSFDCSLNSNQWWKSEHAWTLESLSNVHDVPIPGFVSRPIEKASSKHNRCSSRTPNKRTEEHWRYLIAHGKFHRAKEKPRILPESPSSLPNLRLARYVNIAYLSPYAQAPAFKNHYCSEIF